MHLAEVVTLYDTNANDIPAMLRKCADQIEAGEYGEPECMAATLYTDEGSVVFGWGASSDEHRCISLFQIGSAQLVRNMLD